MKSKARKIGLLGHSDTWVGLGIFVFGAAATAMSSGFDPMSRSYPLLLSILLMVFGSGLILRVVLSSPENVSLVLPGKVAALSAFVVVLWIGALSLGLGFVLPTLLMQIAFLAICGIRPFGRVAIYAALVTLVGYAAFVWVLGVRLPETLSPYLV
nr:tripartite tricarboxylate transporter TctB family protein [Roseovarius sp. MMSF_3281]